MKKILFVLVAMLFATSSLMAQIVSTTPAILQENSKNVVLTYHADQGNKGLMGLSSSAEVYAHIGVITNNSSGSGDWKYGPSKWGDNADKYKLSYVSANTWALNIGDIRTYFGITDATETVKQIAIVFRTGDCAKEGKTAAGGDIFVDVHPAGFQMQSTTSAESNILTPTTNSVTFNVATTEDATLEILINNTVAKSATGTTLSYTHTFSSLGDYEVVARATKGSTVLSKTMSFCYPSNSVAQNYPGGVPKMGAVANADGSVTFCLAAPNKTNVMIVGAWDNYQALQKNVMKYQDYNGNRYFWTTISGLDANKAYPYYYAVDATIKVGDPYAKLVLDPWSDKWISSEVYPNMPEYPIEHIEGVMLAVYKGNIDKYNWKVTDFKAPEAKDLIIYEMIFRDFTGTEGAAEGNGTIRQALDKFDYIKELGVNAVELMPIMEFNGNNSWGYNTNFYFAPDKAYGTHDDYREFIDRCHQEGIAVILDIVFNQSDGLHPWYQMYPIASNPFYNETAPHAYSVLNDWKQDNPLVQQQWKDALQYWLKEFKVDGFRFDLVKGLGDNASYGGDTEKYNQSRIDRMKQLHAWIKEVNPNAYHINEHLAGASEENAMAADGQLNWSNCNNGAGQYAMYYNDADCSGFYAPNWSRTWGSTVAYAESHDEERLGYKQTAYGNGATVKKQVAARMARLGSVAAQMLMTPGPKMIWQFGETGNEQTTKNADGGNNTDPKTVNWNYLNDENRKGLYTSYSELCWLRRSNEDLFTQSSSTATNLTASDWNNGFRIHLNNGAKELICVTNPFPSQKTFSNIPFSNSSDSNYKIASQTYNKTTTFSASAKTVTIPGHSYVVIVNTKVDTGVDTVVDAEDTVKVYGGNGQIVIEGEYNNATVYTVSGQAMGSLEVPAGIYIVNVDGKATKVAVK